MSEVNNNPELASLTMGQAFWSLLFRVYVIAVNTFREGVRSKVIYNLMFFLVIMFIFSFLLGELSLGSSVKVMNDIGLAGISIFALMTSIFVGIDLVYKEIDRRTVYTIISKPIERWQFVVGKYIGLCMTLLAQIVVMWLMFMLFSWWMAGSLQLHLVKAGVGIVLEVFVVTAIAIFFSSFSTPFLSALFTIGTFLIGHSASELLAIGKKSGSEAMIVLMRAATFFDLSIYDLKAEVVHGVIIPFSLLLNKVRIGFAWIAVILIASCFMFSRRDFK